MLPTMAMADEQWTIIDQGGTAIALDSVAFLLASDTEEAFTIVQNNGKLQTGVTEATFKKQDLTGIAGTKADGAQPTLAIEAKSRLTLTGCKEGTAVQLFDTDGRLLRSAQASDGKTTVDVASLKSGVYVIKVGNAAIKFFKK